MMHDLLCKLGIHKWEHAFYGTGDTGLCVDDGHVSEEGTHKIECKCCGKEYVQKWDDKHKL